MRTFHFSPSKKVTSPKCSRLAVLFIYLDVNKRDFRAQPSSRTRIICLKELKRDNEYLIANRKDGTEAVCLHFSATYQLLRLLLDSRTESATYFATVHHSGNRLFCVWCARLAGAECYARHVNKAVDGKQIRESWNEFFCVVLFFLFGAPPRGVVFLLPHMSSVWPECHAPSRSHRQIFFCSVLMFFFFGSFVKATERRVKCKTGSALFVIEDRH